MKIIGVLRTQAEANFTGKINILVEPTSQQLAVIYLTGSLIIGCKYGPHTGRRALYDLCYFLRFQSDKVRFVVEPERVSFKEAQYTISIEELFRQLEKHEEKLSFAPPEGVKLVLNGDFILNGPEVSQGEFELLNVISDYSTLQEIFRNSVDNIFDTLGYLVTLRKKGALRVLGVRHSRL